MSELQEIGTPDIIRLLVGNKCDLINDRQVSVEEAGNFAMEHNMAHIETSALDGSNVDEAFKLIVDEIHKKVAMN